MSTVVYGHANTAKSSTLVCGRGGYVFMCKTAEVMRTFGQSPYGAVFEMWKQDLLSSLSYGMPYAKLYKDVSESGITVLLLKVNLGVAGCHISILFPSRKPRTG